MKGLLLDLVMALALMVAGVITGAVGMSHHNADQLAAAKADTASCHKSNQQQQSTIDAMQRQQQINLQQLTAARRALSAALDQREALATQLQTTAAAQSAAIKETPHDEPSCAALATDPVCPELARRLWGQVADREAAAGH